MAHVINQRGGARIGSEFCTARNSGWPSAHITIAETSIILSVWWKGYYFLNRANITAIRKYQGIFWGKGIQIVHSIDKYPQYMIFWSLQPKKLWRELKQIGYPIDDKIVKMGVDD